MHIVLHQPEIPQNTGNIGRTCVATGSSLHLIEPLGFALHGKDIKRAGMDYWDKLDYTRYTNYEEFKLGTDPNDSSSYFALDALVDENTAETLLFWPSATGVTYTLYFSTNLVLPNAGFSILSNNIPARPPENEFPLTPSNPATFFHLKANYPE